MADGSPEDDAWLCQLVKRAPLLPERQLREHWQRVVPWLSTGARYELAAVLLGFEQSVACE